MAEISCSSYTLAKKSSTGTYTNTNTRRKKKGMDCHGYMIYPSLFLMDLSCFFFVSYAFIDMNYSFSPIIKGFRIGDVLRECETGYERKLYIIFRFVSQRHRAVNEGVT